MPKENEQKDPKDGIVAALKSRGMNIGDIKLLTKDSEVQFKCLKCGNCCRNKVHEDAILLSSLDIYNASKELGITTEDFVKDYCEKFNGCNSGLLCIILKSVEDENGDVNCIMLEKDKTGLYNCKLNKNKPSTCAIYPVGIIHAVDAKTGVEDEPQYILTKQCSESKIIPNKIKVKDILDNLPSTQEERDISTKLRAPHILVGKVNYMQNLLGFSSCMLACNASEKKQEEMGITDKIKQCTKLATELYKNTFKCDPLRKIGFLNDDDILEKAITVNMEMSRMLVKLNEECVYTKFDTSQPYLPQAKKNLDEFNDFISRYATLIKFTEEIYTYGFNEDQIKEFKKFISDKPYVKQD